MRDFTLKIYKMLLSELLFKKYEFVTLCEYIQTQDKNKKEIILRHDVDKKVKNAFKVAKLEHDLKIKSSFYFRYSKTVFNTEIIKNISELGHEIGYHYEVLSKIRGNVSQGIELFEKELSEFRKITDIKTICMHGSPLSRWDSRKLWEKYAYRNFGIIGEPYFDVDFNNVFYLTDTGRRWDGSSVNVRDRVNQNIEDRKQKTEDEKQKIEYRRENIEDKNQESGDRSQKSEEKKFKTNNIAKLKNFFHSTFDIIKAAEEERFPDKIMINIHPQRWNDKFIPWLWELVGQNTKNTIKKLFVMRNERRKGC